MSAPQTDAEVVTFPAPIVDLALGPDGTLAGTTADGSVWLVSDGEPRRVYGFDQPPGEMLVDRWARGWVVHFKGADRAAILDDRGELVAAVEQKGAPLLDVAVRGDEACIVTTRGLSWWDLSGKQLRPNVPFRELAAVKLSPRGTWLLEHGSDGPDRLSLIPPGASEGTVLAHRVVAFDVSTDLVVWADREALWVATEPKAPEAPRQLGRGECVRVVLASDAGVVGVVHQDRCEVLSTTDGAMLAEVPRYGRSLAFAVGGSSFAYPVDVDRVAVSRIQAPGSPAAAKRADRVPGSNTAASASPSLAEDVHFGGSVFCDAASDSDRLGYIGYATALTDFIVDPATGGPLTVAIEAPWGAGKSTFLKLLEKQLDAHPDVVVVRFNAWRHQNDEQVWAAFAIQLAHALAARSPRRVPCLNPIRLAIARWGLPHGRARVVRFLLQALLVGALGAVASIYLPSEWLTALADDDGLAETAASNIPWLAALVLVGQRAYALLSSAFSSDIAQHANGPDYEARTSFLDQFQNDFAAYLDVYLGKKKPGASGPKLVVLVDDLDRCDVPRAAELVRAIHLMTPEADPRVFFVLAMDRAKVAAGIAARNEGLVDYLEGTVETKDKAARGVAYGYRYLEKFVQLPIALPRPTAEQLELLVGSLVAPDVPGTALDRATTTTTLGPTATPEAPSAGRIPSSGNGPSESVPAPAGTNTGSPLVPSPARAADLAPPVVAEISTTERQERELRNLSPIVRVVAPLLDHNPRQVKVFINQMRFRARLVGLRKGRPALTEAEYRAIAREVAVGMLRPEAREAAYEATRDQATWAQQGNRFAADTRLATVVAALTVSPPTAESISA